MSNEDKPQHKIKVLARNSCEAEALRLLAEAAE